MSTAVGVLILDEPQELNPTFRATLEHMPALRTIGEADLEATEGENVALVFVEEGRMADGLARLTLLREQHPGLRTLVAFRALTADGLRALLDAGADAVISRHASPREVCTAIVGLARGAVHLAEPDEPDLMPAEVSDPLGLTPREAEVLRFLSSGFSNKEVARRLALSVRTVETHRLNLRRKTQTGRLKDLVSLARQLGLAPVVEGEPARRGEPAPTPRPARH